MSPLLLESALTQSMCLSQTLLSLKDQLAEEFGVEGIFANVFLPQSQELQWLASVHRNQAVEHYERVQVPDCLAPRLMHRQPGIYIVDDIEDDPFTAAMGRQMAPTMKSYVLIKNKAEGQHRGVVILWSSKKGAFDQRLVDVLKPVQALISLNVGFSLADRMRDMATQAMAKNQQLTQQLADEHEAPLSALIERTPSFAKMAAAIRRVAPVQATVLITGESGTGKEVLANVIHQMSSRKHAPLIKVNCAAMSPQLIEAELFGWEKGAFTDAHQRHAGLFEQAEGGTLFLDEVAELSPAMQVKLLRTLQQGTLRRLGGSQEISVDVRILSATNQPLWQRVQQGQFRLDLYYRLNVYPLHIAPLRERPEDLRALMQCFLEQLSKKYGLAEVPALTESAYAQAAAWPWPGNVRELLNVMTRAVLQANGPIEQLPLEDMGCQPSVDEPVAALSTSWPTFEQMQRTYFEKLLAACAGRISGPQGAAVIAGLHPNTLRSKLEKLGLRRQAAFKPKDSQ